MSNNDLMSFSPAIMDAVGSPQRSNDDYENKVQSTSAFRPVLWENQSDGQLYVAPFDAAQPAFVNGKTICPGSAVAVKAGDSVTVGNSTPLKFSLMNNSAKKASLQKSVHFNDRSPKVFELTPDLQSSEHKSLKGRKQTPLSGFLKRPGIAIEKGSSIRRERPIASVERTKGGMSVRGVTPNKHLTGVERPGTKTAVSSQRITPIKPSVSLKRPATITGGVKQATANVAKLPKSAPRIRAVLKNPAVPESRTRVKPEVAPAKTKKTPVTSKALCGVTPVVCSKSASTKPKFPVGITPTNEKKSNMKKAALVTSASKSVQFTLNNRHIYKEREVSSAKALHKVRQSQYDVDNVAPHSPDDLSLANVSEWIGKGNDSTEDFLTLDSSLTEVNKRSSIGSASKRNSARRKSLGDSNLTDPEAENADEIIVLPEVPCLPVRSAEKRRSRRISAATEGAVMPDAAEIIAPADCELANNEGLTDETLILEENSPAKPTSALKRRRSTKGGNGVTFAEVSSPPRPTAARAAKQVTPANIRSKFRSSVGVSPAQNGSLRKKMLKRLAEIELQKPEDTVSLPVEPKKAVIMSPDGVSMKKLFKTPKNKAEQVSPRAIQNLFVEEPKQKAEKEVLSPVTMKRLFGEKRNATKGEVLSSPTPVQQLFKTPAEASKKKSTASPKVSSGTEVLSSPTPMQQLFKTPAEASKKKSTASPKVSSGTEVLSSPTPMQQLFKTPAEASKKKSTASQMVSPIEMKKIFAEKEQPQSAKPDPVAMSQLFEYPCVTDKSKKVTPAKMKPVIQSPPAVSTSKTPMITPIGMKKMFAEKRQLKSVKPDPVAMSRLFAEKSQKVQCDEFVSPNALRRIFGQKKAKPQLDEEVALSPLFRKPEEEDVAVKASKKARFAEPVLQATPDHVKAVAESSKPKRRRKAEAAKPVQKEVDDNIKPAKSGRSRKAKTENATTSVEQFDEAEEKETSTKRRGRQTKRQPAEKKIVEKDAPLSSETRKNRRAVKSTEEVDVEEKPKQRSQKKQQADSIVEEPKPKRGSKRAGESMDAEPVKKSKRSKAKSAEPVEIVVEEQHKPKRGKRSQEPVEQPKHDKKVPQKASSSAKKAVEEEPAAVSRLPRKSTIRVTRAMSKTEKPSSVLIETKRGRASAKK